MLGVWLYSFNSNTISVAHHIRFISISKRLRCCYMQRFSAYTHRNCEHEIIICSVHRELFGINCLVLCTNMHTMSVNRDIIFEENKTLLLNCFQNATRLPKNIDENSCWSDTNRIVMQIFSNNLLTKCNRQLRSPKKSWLPDRRNRGQIPFKRSEDRPAIIVDGMWFICRNWWVNWRQKKPFGFIKSNSISRDKHHQQKHRFCINKSATQQYLKVKLCV